MGFGGTATVFTRGHGGKDDKTPAKLGSLSASGMIQTTGLAACNGHEAVLITGDREQHLKGKETIARIGDVFDTTTGAATFTTTKTKKEFINQDSFTKVSRNVTYTVMGLSKMTYTGGQVVDLKAERHETEWQARWHSFKECFHGEVFRVDTFYTSYMLYTPFSVTGFGINVDLRGANFAFVGTYADFMGVRLHDSAEDVENAALKANFKTLNTYFYCVKNALGPAVLIEADAILHTLGIGPNVPL